MVSVVTKAVIITVNARYCLVMPTFKTEAPHLVSNVQLFKCLLL